MTSNIGKFINFFKVNQMVTLTSQWHHNKGYIGHLITLVIISAFCTVCTVVKFVLEVWISVNWSLDFCQFGVCQANTAHFCTVVF